MVNKNKNNLALLKVDNLSDDELDAALDRALDSLFGEANQHSAKTKEQIAKGHLTKETKPKKLGKKNQ